MHGCKAGWPCALLQHARRPFHAKGAVGRALANLAACVCGACAEPAAEGRARSSTSWPFPMRFETRKRPHCGLFRVCEAAGWLCDAGAGFVPSIDVCSISRKSRRFPNWKDYLAAQPVHIGGSAYSEILAPKRRFCIVLGLAEAPNREQRQQQ